MGWESPTVAELLTSKFDPGRVHGLWDSWPGSFYTCLLAIIVLYIEQ